MALGVYMVPRKLQPLQLSVKTIDLEAAREATSSFMP